MSFTLRCVCSHLEVKNALNLVSKISLLGDDRREPQRAYQVTLEINGGFQGQFFPNHGTFALNTLPVNFFYDFVLCLNLTSF